MSFMSFLVHFILLEQKRTSEFWRQQTWLTRFKTGKRRKFIQRCTENKCSLKSRGGWFAGFSFLPVLKILKIKQIIFQAKVSCFRQMGNRQKTFRNLQLCVKLPEFVDCSPATSLYMDSCCCNFLRRFQDDIFCCDLAQTLLKRVFENKTLSFFRKKDGLCRSIKFWTVPVA